MSGKQATIRVPTRTLEEAAEKVLPLKENYRDFMDKLFDKGYAKKVANKDLLLNEKWYLVHILNL